MALNYKKIIRQYDRRVTFFPINYAHIVIGAQTCPRGLEYATIYPLMNKYAVLELIKWWETKATLARDLNYYYQSLNHLSFPTT
jgi:hypothetical protein